MDRSSWSKPFISFAASAAAYQIGNSYSEDAGATPGTQIALAADENIQLGVGYHIWHGHQLTDIAATPGTWDEVLPTQWNTALPAAKRALFNFEPYGEPAETGTIGTEVAAMATFAASIATGPTVNPRFYMYASWTSTSDYTNYQTWWTAAVVDNDSTHFSNQRQTFDYAYNRMAAADGAANVWLVPVGEVMYQLDIASRAGQFTGATELQSWYRDGIHMGIAGQYAATCTTVAVYFHKPCTPSAATIALFQTRDNGTSPVVFDASVAAQISTIVWNVVSSDPRAFH